MRFFVPETDDESDAERTYATLAELAGVPVPAMDQRVYMISWVDPERGEEMTAEVGRALRGITTELVKKRSPKERTTRQTYDEVLAIFPSEPVKVVLRTWPVTSVPSAWENPIPVAGSTIKKVTNFE
jgi:hypothetical protein